MKMELSRGPWDAKWRILRNLSKDGGQGTTWVVEPKTQSDDSPSEAVLKVLKNHKKPQARRRMFQEVNNLRLMHSAGGSVPRVLDGNTDAFEDESAHLYFVMECISGGTLTSLVQEKGPLSLKDAGSLIKDLAATIAIGHKNTILHRDLKPDNVAVRDLANCKTVLLDLGLSFNDESGFRATQEGEQFKNSFLTLPEYTATGDDRREKPSDITALLGIFYYLLTGCAPEVLRDGKNRAPHRRPGQTLKERMAQLKGIAELNLLFDRGFEQQIELRFQSLEDLLLQVNGILDPSPSGVNVDPIQTAARVQKELLQFDVKTRAASFQPLAEQVFKAIEDKYRTLHGKLGHFTLGFRKVGAHGAHPDKWHPIANDQAIITVSTLGHEDKYLHANYRLSLDGNQCVVLRSHPIIGFPPNDLKGRSYTWFPVMWLGMEGLTSDTSEVLSKDVDKLASEMIESLGRTIVQTETARHAQESRAFEIIPAKIRTLAKLFPLSESERQAVGAAVVSWKGATGEDRDVLEQKILGFGPGAAAVALGEQQVGENDILSLANNCLSHKQNLVFLDSRSLPAASEPKTCYYSFHKKAHGYDGMVSLEFGNGGDNFQVQMYGGQKNSFIDLKETDFGKIEAPQSADDRDTWEERSLPAVEGHSYLEHIWEDKIKFYVKFKVLALEPRQYVLLLWERMPDKKVFF